MPTFRNDLYSRTDKNKSFFHTLNKGGIIMKQAKPIVHCIYTESNKSLTQLLDEYFRAYLSCSLEMTNKAMLPYLK